MRSSDTEITPDIELKILEENSAVTHFIANLAKQGHSKERVQRLAFENFSQEDKDILIKKINDYFMAMLTKLYPTKLISAEWDTLEWDALESDESDSATYKDSEEATTTSHSESSLYSSDASLARAASQQGLYASRSAYYIRNRGALHTTFGASGSTMLAAGMLGAGLLFLKGYMGIPVLSLIAMPIFGISLIAAQIFIVAAAFTLINYALDRKARNNPLVLIQ